MSYTIFVSGTEKEKVRFSGREDETVRFSGIEEEKKRFSGIEEEKMRFSSIEKEMRLNSPSFHSLSLFPSLYHNFSPKRAPFHYHRHIPYLYPLKEPTFILSALPIPSSLYRNPPKRPILLALQTVPFQSYSSPQSSPFHPPLGLVWAAVPPSLGGSAVLDLDGTGSLHLGVWDLPQLCLA